MMGDKCKREKLLGLVMSAFNRQGLVSDMFEMQPKYLGFEAEPNPAEFEVAQDGNVASDCKFTSGPILKPHSLMTMVTSTISVRISRGNGSKKTTTYFKGNYTETPPLVIQTPSRRYTDTPNLASYISL